MAGLTTRIDLKNSAGGVLALICGRSSKDRRTPMTAIDPRQSAFLPDSPAWSVKLADVTANTVWSMHSSCDICVPAKDGTDNDRHA